MQFHKPTSTFTIAQPVNAEIWKYILKTVGKLENQNMLPVK